MEKFINLQTMKSQKINVSNSLFSADNTKFGEKLIIKKSYIGSNCSLGSNVKVENSILFGVKVHDG